MFKRLFGTPKFQQTNPAEVQEWIKSKKEIFILDVRTPGEYKKDGHIKGSTLIPLQELPGRMNELPGDKEIVVVCRSGGRSSNACRQLAANRFESLYNLRGGMLAWGRSGLPVKK